MVQITYTLRLDMRDTGIVNTSLRLKQGDSGMKIAVNVFNGGVSAFDSSTTPKIVFRRPDGASVMADMTVESSLYSYTLVGNELQVPGKELIDIKFPIGTEGRESTMSCSIEVVPDTITPNTHGSGIYDNDLAVLVEEATEAAETVQEVVGDSEAWADGERNGVPVGPEDPAYHNNSKYWSEQANPTALANLTDVDVDGVVNGDVLRYNSSTQKWEGKSISSGTNEIIAPVEGATSLHAYEVGEQLIYNDTLYKVIAPIAVNDALVVDTNIEVSPKTVIEQVDGNKKAISQLSNENLLDNPWFTVNQRGLTSYGGDNVQNNCVDRWQRRNTTNVTVTSTGVTVKSVRNESQADSWLRQVICLNADAERRFIGKALTVSILFGDGTIISMSTSNFTGSFGRAFTNSGSNGSIQLINDTTQGTLQLLIWVTTYNVAVPIKAAKLEYGTVSTLHLDGAPDYAKELHKCQYYFVRIKGVNNNIFANGWFTDAGYANFIVPLPRPMRNTPAVTINGTIYVWSPTKLGAGAYQSSTLYASNYSNNGVEVLAISVSGTETVGNNAMAQFRDTTSYVDLSAEFN